MNIALWIVQVLLALVFAMAGAFKLARTKEQLATKLAWVKTAAPSTIKLIGGLEVLGAIGLIAPPLTGILPWLTPLAAIGLALTMIGAMITHARLGEYPAITANVILLLLAAFVVYGRFVAPLG